MTEFFKTIIKYQKLKKGRRKYGKILSEFAFFLKKYIIRTVFNWKFIKKKWIKRQLKQYELSQSLH